MDRWLYSLACENPEQWRVELILLVVVANHTHHFDDTRRER